MLRTPILRKIVSRWAAPVECRPPRARSDDDPRPASGEIALDDSNAFLERTDEVIERTRLKAVPV